MQRTLKAIGGSDAHRIIAGKWHQLWLEKSGRDHPPDLDAVLPVQMGKATEWFHRLWYSRQTGHPLHSTGTYISLPTNWTITGNINTCPWSGWVTRELQHPEFRQLVCNLDAWRWVSDSSGPRVVIDFKHTGEGTQDHYLIDRYAAQVRHNMFVTGTRMGELSVLFGNKRWKVLPIDFDAAWLDQYLEACEAFLWHLNNDAEPEPDTEDSVAPTTAVAGVPTRVLDMNGSNEWAAEAADWLADGDAARRFDEAKKALKSHLPADARLAFGHGVMAVRSSSGAVSIKPSRIKDTDAAVAEPFIASEETGR